MQRYNVLYAEGMLIMGAQYLWQKVWYKKIDTQMCLRFNDLSSSLTIESKHLKITIAAPEGTILAVQV